MTKGRGEVSVVRRIPDELCIAPAHGNDRDAAIIGGRFHGLVKIEIAGAAGFKEDDIRLRRDGVRPFDIQGLLSIPRPGARAGIRRKRTACGVFVQH